MPLLIFDFDLIMGSFFHFLGPQWAIFEVGIGLKTVFGSTHVVKQLSFCMIPLFLTFDFDLILGSCLTF